MHTFLKANAYKRIFAKTCTKAKTGTAKNINLLRKLFSKLGIDNSTCGLFVRIAAVHYFTILTSNAKPRVGV
jgi:hypothetical protein